MEEFLSREYFKNTVLDYLIALGIIITGLIVVRILRTTVIRRLHRWADNTETKADNFIIQSFERFGIPALYYFVIYSGATYLVMPLRAHRIIEIATTAVVTFLVIRLLSSTVLLLLQSHIRKQERGEEKINQLGGLMIVINIIFWGVGLVFLLDNLGQNVTAILTGLGIGGIAVALAAQNILGDLFNYFVIFFDRPFEVGDFVIFEDKMGTIEYIGIKTTRIRSLSGEQLIVGNSNLTGSRIHNYKRMQRRRILFSIDVEYGTPLEKVKEIPGLLRGIVEDQKDVLFDRSHFARFADSGLRFDVVYFVLSGDFNPYMDIQQEINFRIYEAFTERGVSFAFPSRTLYVRNDDAGLKKLLEKEGRHQNGGHHHVQE